MSDFLKPLMVCATIGASVSLAGPAAFAQSSDAKPETDAAQTETQDSNGEQTEQTSGSSDTETPTGDTAAPSSGTSSDDTSGEQSTQVPDMGRADGLVEGKELSAANGADGEIGKVYPVSEHGDWKLRCIKAPEGTKDPCQLFQMLKDQQGNPIANINLFSLPEGDNLVAGATVLTPLETLLTQNVVLSVDGGKPKVYPFTFCTAMGCLARVGFTAGDIAGFKAGNKAKITVVPAQAPDQRVELTVSLKGFTEGFEAIKKSQLEGEK